MKGLIGKKLGMTRIFNEDGTSVGVTIIEVDPNVVVQIRTPEKDGYYAVQLGYGERKVKNTPKPLLKHFEKAGTTPKRKLVEFRDFPIEVEIGQTLTIEDVFSEGEIIDVTGRSKGKGFQGVVKRHGFSGVGGQTHGQKDQERHGGSIGAATFPARVVKGKRMAGRMGNEKVTVKNLEIVKIIPEKNWVLIKGSVPGPKGEFVILRKKIR